MTNHFFALLFVAGFVILIQALGRRLVSLIVLGALISWLLLALIPLGGSTHLFEIFTFTFFLFSIYISIKVKRIQLRQLVLLLGQSTVIYFLIQFSMFLYISLHEEWLTQFVVYLTLGYDNGVHLENFISVALAGGSIDFRGYPMGLYSFWYLFSRILNLPVSEPSEILMTFFALTIITWAFSIYASAAVIKKASASRSLSILKTTILIFIITFGAYGFMLTSGYPPYTFAISIILLLIAAINEAKSFAVLFALVTGTFFIGLLLMPLVVATVIPFAIAIMWKYLNSLKWFTSFRKTKFVAPSFVLLFALSFLTFYWILRSYGVNQVFEPGGIEPLRYRWLVAMSFLCIILLVASRKNVFQAPQYMGNIIFTCLSISIVLALLTANVNGVVTYYAFKEFQVLGFLLVVFVLGLQANRTYKGRLALASAYVSCFVLIMQPALQPRIFTTGFMGSTQNAIRVVMQPSEWESQIVDAPFLVRAVDDVELSSNECGVVWTKEHNATLSGRWFNASYPKFAGNCYNIYYDSENQTDEEVLSEVANPDIDVVVVVDDRPLSELQQTEIANSGDRVERIE